MKPVLSMGTVLFHGDGKPHPVEGVILFIILFLAIICFNKWVIQGEKTHERHYKSDKTLKGERNLSTRFGHSILQMIDFFCGVYFFRGIRLNDEPFRKATETEKRVGGCFMVLLPVFFVVMIINNKSFDKMIDSMMYGHLGMGWFYLSFIALIGGGVVFRFKVAPKIPLFVSVPLAVGSWLVLAWVVWKHDLI